MPKRKRDRLGRFVRRARMNPLADVLAVNPRRRKRRSYARSRTKRYSRNPTLMELAALNPLSARKKRRITRMSERGASISSIARKLSVKPRTVRRYVSWGKPTERKFKQAFRAGLEKSIRSRGRDYRRSRHRYVMPIRLPEGAKSGKVRVELNPRLSWGQLKEGATTGLYAIGGFAASSFLTNLIASKFTGTGGTGMAIGPFGSKTVVSTAIALAVPFVPLQFRNKHLLVAGIWVNAFSNLIRDLLPTDSAIGKHIPMSLGDYTQKIPSQFSVPQYPQIPAVGPDVEVESEANAEIQADANAMVEGYDEQEPSGDWDGTDMYGTEMYGME